MDADVLWVGFELLCMTYSSVVGTRNGICIKERGMIDWLNVITAEGKKTKKGREVVGLAILMLRGW